MSRTFRRKGYEEANMSWKDGTKVAGFYTQDNWCYLGGSRKAFITYRKPTRQEHNEAYWHIHGDSNRNEWSPNRFYREYRMQENRTFNKTELVKYLKDTNYEVMAEANPRSCLWDWS